MLKRFKTHDSLKHLKRVFKTPLVITLLLTVILIAVLFAQPSSLGERLVLELGVYAFLLLLCLSHKPLRNIFGKMGRFRLALLITFFLLWLTTQLFKIGGSMYPFVNWTMYADATPSPEYYDYKAELTSGSTIAFPFKRVTPSSAPSAFAGNFTRPLKHLDKLDPGTPARATAAAELRHLLTRLSKTHNHHYPADPIRRVNVSLCRVLLESPRNPGSVSCRGVLSVDVSS